MAPTTDAKNDRYTRNLNRLITRLDRIETFLDTIEDTAHLADVLARKNLLDETWATYKELVSNNVNDDEQEAVCETIEFRYPTIRATIIREELRRTPKPEKNVCREAPPSTAYIKLPKLNINPFLGEDITMWPQFKDIFESAVHNVEQIPAIQKFQILLGLLKGDALAEINDIKITDANYYVAYDKLLNKFDKPKRIISAHLNSFFNIPAVKDSNPKALSKLCGQSEGVLRQLSMLHKSAEKRDVWIIHILLNKVDQQTRDDWAKKTVTTHYPTEAQFFEFLKERCDALDNSVSVTLKSKGRSSETTKGTFVHHTSAFSCPVCNGDHNLFKCANFKGLEIDSRRQVVRDKNLCFNCLSKGHSGANCKSRFRCHHCEARHHTLLHTSKSSNTNQSNQASTSVAHSIDQVHVIQSKIQSQPLISNTGLETQTSQVTDHSQPLNCNLSQDSPAFTRSVKFVLLPTILLHIRDKAGNMQSCRALLDTGSQSSFITEDCIQRLGLPRLHARISVTGLAEKGAGVTRGLVHLALHSRHNSKSSINIDALILSKLTQVLPSYTIQAKFEEFTHLPLADPTFQTPGKVDILIGAGSAFHILKPETIITNKSGLIAQNTIFGWIISGEIHNTLQSTTTQSLTTQLSLQSIDFTLRRFWEIDELVTDKCLWSEEEKMCEAHFLRTHKRDENGRYIVELPFKEVHSQLGNSLFQASKRQYSIERRLSSNKNLQDEYTKFIEEYMNLGHMHIIPLKEIEIAPQNVFYLPHHPVVKADSTTTKVRVVFDASAKSTSGMSLNDTLMVGPTLQNTLFAIILRFRRHRIAFSADVEKMYRQVKVAEHHQDYQRIVWRNTPNSALQHYRLSTVTYGTAAAPFLATRVLHQLAEVNKGQYRSAADAIQQDFYVDDLMTGADSLTAALKLQGEIFNILQSGGLVLRKWACNEKGFLSHIQTADRSAQNVIDLDDDVQTIKVLGLQWCPVRDQFCFKVSTTEIDVNTKRGLLSEAAKLFDPLGWLAPVIIKIKILFQQLWIYKVDWDDSLPSDTIDEWKKIKSQMKTLEKIQIPRWLSCSPDIIDLQIHGFCDSSQLAYAAVLYCRIVDKDNKVSINLITSKTKVAPIRQLSIPRLELCAAQLLKNLLEVADSTLQLQYSKIVLWTDSTIVLSWLSAIPRSLKTFVANRVADIQSTRSAVIWKHVGTAENPADCASRGLNPSELINHSLWWNGPKWLTLSEESWPIQKPLNSKDLPELKTSKIAVHQATNQDDVIDLIMDRISNWMKMIRVLAYVRRFCRMLKQQYPRFITSSELCVAENSFIRHIQASSFNDEMHALSNERSLHKKSNLLMLHPFIDNEGILRVGGRIQKSQAQFSAIHPIIIPSKHEFTERLIQFYHHKYLHAGASTLISIIRQKFWVINCKQAIKTIVRKCPTCIRYNGHPLTQIMGNLPEARVQGQYPFIKAAVDYAGPFAMKTHKTRGSKSYKAYISLFVCQSTKALHLELVTDLTTEGFLACLKRFTGRRGICKELYSDNGSNFIGAKRELNELHRLILQNTNNTLISESLAQDGTKWSLMPPMSPHFGGLHEAGVKSVKSHLKKSLGSSFLTYEEMSTILVQIEGILNSRPICRTDDADIDALTPAHFLIGHHIPLVPEPNLQDVNLSHLSRWQYIQRITQQFWKRWSLEYLCSLQRRAKWGTTTTNLELNDVVILKDENLPPAKWALARVIQLHPGEDGNVRIVTLKTKAGNLKRPITKIIPLPIS